MIKKSLFLIAFLMASFGLPAQAEIPAGITFETFYDTAKVSFEQPTFVGPVPGSPDQLVVVERAGKVFTLAKNGAAYNKQLWFSVDANVATHWDGAWTVEFHPNFLTNHLFYVLYRQKNNETRSVIEEWKTAGNDLSAPVKVRAIIEFNQKTIHSSGDMKFGPDGFLYSSQGDRQVSGQTLTELWGKVIRINVNAKDPGLEYSIPTDNPFRSIAGTRPEIWALGFRMPWRFSFDKLNGDLWLGDVGDVLHEEVNLVRKGLNYGAGVVEGNCTTNCGTLTNPLINMSRDEGNCVIGGFVYREDPASKFYGTYLFADYGTKLIYGARLNPEKTAVAEMKSIAGVMPGFVSALGQDGRGNFYAAMYKETGASVLSQIYRLKHAELKPAVATGLRPDAKHSSLGPLPIDMQSSAIQIFGLDGKVLSKKALELHGKPVRDLLIIRDARTGLSQKLAPIQ